MCGLAGFIVKDRRVLTPARRERLLDGMLNRVDHRGGDATGLLAVTRDGAPFLVKASCKAAEFARNRPALPLDTAAVIGHTRFATLGSAAFPFNNHPVRVGETYVAHNGHVTNHDAIAKGTRAYFHQVDSAAIAAALDHGKWESTVAIAKALELIDGAAAVVAAAPHLMRGRTLLARVSSSPLYVWEGRSAVLWASTEWAISESWRKVVGSPPKRKAIRAMREGEALLVGDDGTIERFSFTPKPPTFARNYLSGWSDDDYADWEKSSGGHWVTTTKGTQKFAPSRTATTKPKLALAAAPQPLAKTAADLLAEDADEDNGRMPTAALLPSGERGETCDGCWDVFPAMSLDDYGVGFYCDTCIEFAEDTGTMPSPGGGSAV